MDKEKFVDDSLRRADWVVSTWRREMKYKEERGILTSKEKTIYQSLIRERMAFVDKLDSALNG
jgi:hypothetical protein